MHLLLFPHKDVKKIVHVKMGEKRYPPFFSLKGSNLINRIKGGVNNVLSALEILCF